jgi:uncharacterized protein YicC (UPF0701 family)
MCRACREQAVALAADSLPSERTFWRDLTPAEMEFGDIPRVASDVDSAELHVVTAVKPAVKELVAGVVAEAMKAIRARDMRTVTDLPSDYEAVTKAVKAAAGSAIDAGKAQVFDAYRAQTGHRLALPPRKNPRLTAAYLNAKAEIQAAAINAAAKSAAQKAAISQIARGVEDRETLEALTTTAAEQSLVATAVETAREGIAVGRMLAIQDTENDIEAVIYTAIMDTNVCEVCMSADQTEYATLAEAADVPNPDCVGEQYGNVCRCNLIVVYKKG